MLLKPLTLKALPYLRRIQSVVRQYAATASALSDEIARLAEPPMQEFQSADRMEAFLSSCGFEVTRPWPLLPTAFRAVAGRGKPVIAMLAEYDALPDCGQKPGHWGHGCGHNLLGTGAALAGIAAARTLNDAALPGQIVVFGCPAEEYLHGKVFMAALGAFNNLDAVLAWHPSIDTAAGAAGGAAMDSIRFRFRGRTSHAAACPDNGRSALDAAILTDVAVNYLREHVEENVRMHSVIPHGGKSPNVVPDQAEIWYFLRGKDRKQVDNLRRRVALCARGAAMATETRMSMRVETCIAERIRNETMSGMMDAWLRRCGPPEFTAADVRKAGGKKYSTLVKPPRLVAGRASSDEDNVSWFAPLGHVLVACLPEGVPGHHRERAAAAVLPAAHKGMLRAAEVLAAAAVELAVNAPLLRQAKAHFRANRKGKVYDLPLSSVRPAKQGSARR